MEQGVETAARGGLPLRDIAAYWGRQCEYEYLYAHREQLDQAILGPLITKRIRVDGVIDSERLGQLSTLKIYDFKVYLRHLSSLTDEEVLLCAELSGVTYKGIIERTDRHIDLFDTFIIEFGPENFFISWPNVFDDIFYPAPNVGAIISYLQRQGIYVPGTIDENLVELI